MSLLFTHFSCNEMISARDLAESVHALLKYNNTVYTVFFLSCHESV